MVLRFDVNFLKQVLQVTKPSIILFVVLSGLMGFLVSHSTWNPIEFVHVVILCAGLAVLSGGSFAINQAQEWHLDLLMPRTAKRPIPSGVISAWQAYAMGIALIALGLILLFLLSPLVAALGAATVLLYNGLYTLYWKKHWAFGAVPGAIPGAMPVVIGFAVNSSDILSLECIYLFLIMFLWQMPHFWCLAIRYADDYSKASIPVLPVAIGKARTLYHIGLYLFVYVALALASPWFVKTHVFYLLFVVPIAIKLIYEFIRYFDQGRGSPSWLRFFLWVNVSLLVFLAVPVFDRWIF